ncbi:hypothetical protein EV196_11522 [Mariniflexile fucanivorans]|uniref:Uncharacterized protein n=1 Tax=Mariniflexile fucanivorans TaxID=264023 RepID=A0A4R1R982_9FLAO|nr:hypothetical protein [Mariniflexile fucanivorans]TCL62254.1 hypothetical protein EV196_11522 [Mariniflexile fucanivorans]
MKNLIYIILGAIIGAVLTYYFCPRQLEGEESVKIVKPKNVISVKEAKVLNDNWTLYRKAAVDSAAQKQGRKEDDRSTYWSLTDIENYLEFAKNESDSLGYQMTGIRVYLGVYGKDADESKKDLTTMFIVPTGSKSKASSLNLNFIGNDEDVPGGSPLNRGTGGGGGYPQ